MPFKQYDIPLENDSYIAVEFETISGEVRHMVVRLMRKDGPGVFCAARYDTAHGQAHRDIVDRKGRLIRKDWLEGFAFAEALDYAIWDFKRNYAEYTKK